MSAVREALPGVADVISKSWAQRHPPATFAVLCADALRGQPLHQHSDIKLELGSQLVAAASVGRVPSALLIEYLEHALVLGSVPVSPTLTLLLDSSLLSAEAANAAR
jgi:hypothetical protein